MNLNRKLGIYGRFLAAYILFLLIVSLFSFFFIDIYQDFIKAETLNHKRVHLQSEIKTIDTRINEVENIVHQVGITPGINSFLNVREMSGPQFYQFQKTWKTIPNYPLTNEFIVDLFIYFKNSDVLLSYQKASHRSELFYETMIEYSDLSYGQWMDQIVLPPSSNRYIEVQDVEIDDVSYQALTLAQSLPQGYSINIRGTILVVLNSDIISRPMDSVIGSEGRFLITDSKDGVIISTFSEEEWDILEESIASGNGDSVREVSFSGEKWFLITESSYRDRWQYSIALPQSVVFSKVDELKRLTGILAFSGLLLLIPAALLIAHFNSLPLRRIFKSISDGSAPHELSGPLEQIEKTIESLSRENTSLTQSLEEQNPIMRNRMVERVIRGRFKDETALEAALEMRKIDLEGEQFLTVLAVLERGYGDIREDDSLKVLNLFTVLIQETMGNILGSRTISCNFEEDIIAFLISVDPERDYRSEMETLLGNIRKTFEIRHGLSIIFTAGSLRNSIMDVYISTTEALNALEHIKSESDLPVFWHDRAGIDSAGYFYPLNHEHRLINFIKSGQQEQVKTLFALFEEENFSKRDLSRSEARSFLRECLSTVGKAYNSMGDGQKEMLKEIPVEIQNLRDEIRGLKNSQEGVSLLGKILLLTSKLYYVIDDAKLSHNDKLIGEVSDYIRENYHDFNLSLSGIAEKFDLTEAYLSNFFKEQTGIKYSAFIEELRMGKAKELLKTAMPIGEIVRTVGYVSKNTFYKAFKRAEGISPGSFRDQAK